MDSHDSSDGYECGDGCEAIFEFAGDLLDQDTPKWATLLLLVGVFALIWWLHS